MANENTSKGHPQSSEEGNSWIFKALMLVIGASVLVVILKGAGIL